MNVAPTKPVYQYDETLRKHLTRVVAIRAFDDLSSVEQPLFKNAKPDTFVLETTDTIFYAQGGGQPFDVGYVSSSVAGEKEARFEVEAVRYGAEGRILHFGRFHEGSFSAGEMVEQQIDGARRDQNSRVHTAGHIIGLAVRRLAKSTAGLNVVELKAQHYPDASFVEFNGILDSKYKDAIQAQASQYVKDALPVKLYWYKPEELAEKGVITAEGMPIVTGFDGNVRVVDIVGAGAYPCGGTHTQATDQVGEIVVKGIKRQKGISKVSYSIADRI